MRLPLLLALLLATPALAAPEDARISRILAATPLIDGHNDWAEQLRQDYGEGWWGVDLAADSRTFKHPLQTDIPRLRAGHVGGQFWSVYVPASLTGPAAIKATLEQIDIVRGIVARYPATFELASTAADVRRIHKAGRIASLIGVEGGHQMGESLPALRMFYALGARYMTLTHFANNAWADSATDAPAHNGLTPFGKAVVTEMNRLGMLVDLSHVSEKTMTDALAVTKAPVIFSHSSARALNDHPRNVPDAVLRLLPANGGVVMVNWVPSFDDPKRFQYEQDLAGAEGAAKVRYIGQPDRTDAAVAAWKAAHPAARYHRRRSRRPYRAHRKGCGPRTRRPRCRSRRHPRRAPMDGRGRYLPRAARRTGAARVERRRPCGFGGRQCPARARRGREGRGGP